MNGYANVLLTTLLSWVQGVARSLWRLFSGEGGGLLTWVADHWLLLTILLCAAGMTIDLVVHLLRWRSDLVWASFFRRLRSRGGQREGESVRHWVYADGRARTEAVSPEEAEESQPLVIPPPLASRLPDIPAQDEFPAAQEPDAPNTPPETVPALQEAPVRRRRAARYAAKPRSGMRIAQLFSAQEMEEELPRYQPGTLPTSKDQAYHEPYIPPQWKNPDDSRRDGHGG